MCYEADREGIEVGDKLSDGERNVGEVVNVAGCDLLAVTPVDLHQQALKIGGTGIIPRQMPYEM
jgi:hypothetical protein